MEYKAHYLNIVNGVKRRLQRRKFSSKRKDVQPKSAATSKWQINSKNISLFLVVIIVVVLISVGYLAVRFFSFHPQKFSPNEQVAPTVVSGAPYTVMFMVYNKYDTYSFVDMIALLTISNNSEPSRLMLINPDVSSEIPEDNQTKIRSLINYAQLQARDPMTTITKSLEDMLALPVDRYVVVEKQQMLNLITNLGINYLTDQDINDPDAGKFIRGEVLSGGKLVNYLAADVAGWDSKNARIEKFFKDRLASLNISVFLKLLLTDNLSSYIATNLTSGEIFNLCLQINANPALRIIDLSSSVFHQVKTADSTVILPATTDVDNTLMAGYQRVDVMREQVRIEVYNATNVSGLANQTKRMLANQGANVIRAGNYPNTQDKNKLYVKDLNATKYNVLLIKQLLRDNVTIINADYPFNHTGELVLVLGGTQADQ